MTEYQNKLAVRTGGPVFRLSGVYLRGSGEIKCRQRARAHERGRQ